MRRIYKCRRDLVPNAAVWPPLVVVSTLSLQLFGGVGKAQEPVDVEALRP